MKIEKITNSSLELTDNQLKKLNKWIESFGKLPNIGATGGHFGIKIIFTSLGNIIVGESWNGKTIDLTETDDFT